MLSAPHAGFRIERTTTGAMTIIAVFGELDLATKPRLAQEVDSVLMSRPMIVAIDLRGLSFMDSSGSTFSSAPPIAASAAARDAS